MRKIGVVGAGHVGLVTAGCFAKLGHNVICADNDASKISEIEKGVMPFYEPGLKELVDKEKKEGRLSFTTSVEQLTLNSEVIFIAVGTPPTGSGGADLSYVENVTLSIAEAIAKCKKNEIKGAYKLIVEKSTVPVLTGEWVKRTLALIAHTGIEFDVAANPEFLREGSAIKDFMFPDRIVVGAESERAVDIFKDIYSGIKAPIVFTDVKSAEMIKHASNSYLAMKISYINAVSVICEKVGADVEKVAEGMGYDRRIGKEFLQAGVGWGGSCFPKDVSAFINLAEQIGYPFNLLKEVENINREQKLVVIKKARELLWNIKGKKIAVFGLSFKPDTDDVRESPAVDIIRMLSEEGAVLSCFDPQAQKNMKKIFPDIEYADSPYEAASEACLLIFLTAWADFKKLDFVRLKEIVSLPYLIDGRNFLDSEKLQKAGFIYKCIGKT